MMCVAGLLGLIDKGVSDQEDGSDRDRDVGNIEYGPAQVTDPTVYEVDNLLLRESVDQVPHGAPRYQTEREMLPSLRGR